ncbi:hypothetical protein RRG08_064609 [Elysia crispata]|uniref:Uncharacterized protein n=1 Tax=Elysia crispata TaxID=231223 RepID=A0AAE1B9Y1_9GAST|nr:hypothetical protein RRG08_064609 [Elysia crispata]
MSVTWYSPSTAPGVLPTPPTPPTPLPHLTVDGQGEPSSGPSVLIASLLIFQASTHLSGPWDGVSTCHSQVLATHGTVIVEARHERWRLWEGV